MRLLMALYFCAALHAQLVGFPKPNVPYPHPGGGACTATVGVINEGSMSQASASSFSDTYSIATSDANTAFFLRVLFDGSGAAITNCTVNGKTANSAGTPAHHTTDNLFAQIFYVMNPGAGDGLTYGCTGNASVAEFYYAVLVLSNVNATTPVRAGSYQTLALSAANSGSYYSMTVSSNAQDRSMTAIEPTSGAPSSNQTYVSSGSGTYYAAADRATTPAASVTHNWTTSGNAAIVGLSAQCK